LIPNLIILGLDLGFFFRLGQNGDLFFTSNFQQHPPALYNFDLIVQAWTLSLELLFYLLVPFLNRLKNKNIILLMFLSLFLRFYLYSIGLNHDPWNYRFFPNELIFFLSGILMYRSYLKIKNQKIKYLPNFIFLSYISYLILYQFLPHETTKQIALFLLSFISLPFIFNLFKNNKLDRFIGELSFPVYICHFLIINIFTHLTKLPHQFLGLSTTIFSILISILILKFIINPIDNYRQSRVVLN
jgi:peptidoglycan/LPS O-acetylase OafA/YrhL